MNPLYKTIRDSGGRLTNLKKTLIDVLSEKNCLLSKAELIKKLKVKKINPDRSTLYRELKLLTEKNIVSKNTISGTDYYEILGKDHHHHLVCLKCNRVEKVALNNQLERQEKLIAKRKKFNIINHSLEFFGYCRKCQAQFKI